MTIAKGEQIMEVRLPRLGEGADTGTVASIFVKEGDSVKKDQAILELESEKAVASIPTPHAGTISKIHVQEGDQIKVGDLILSLSGDGGQTVEEKTVSEQPPDEKRPKPEREEPRREERVEPQPEVAIQEPVRSEFAPPASPSIRKTARELGIDLRRVRGSERGGRIVLADVRRYIEQLQHLALQPRQGATAAPKAPAEQVDFAKWGSVSRKKLTSIRRTISRRMVQSWTTLPHITQFDDVDITHLNTLRKKYADAYEREGARLTLTPFILKSIVSVLKEYPVFNASVDEGADEIVYKEYYHIGIAVDTENGLLVPVIRDVDRKSLLDLSIELGDLAEKARDRKISLEEMQGGTFTISNQGGIGGAHFTPIINKPEVAILGLGRGGMKPVVRNKKIEPRMMLPLALSYDHRLIDGADAARFITKLVQVLETFGEEDVQLGKRSTKAHKGVKKGKK
jgi:pyruvate dehydrogenase E2 component (dihydrolipoyllysine-residue acetyltransferase)